MNAGSPSTTLYERLGGQAGINALVEQFYARVIADPVLAPFFEGVPMEKLRKMQSEFFAAALDGPQKYSGRSIAAVHHGRGISRSHFSAFCQHLFVTLEGLGVSPADINATVGRIAMSARDITGEPTIDG